MKNRIADLNNALFEQLERLNDGCLDSEGIERETRRAEAMCGVADRITANHGTVIRVFDSAARAGIVVDQVPLLEFLGEPPQRGG